MRPVIQTITGTGPSGWTMVDYIQRSFAIGFLCTVGGTGSPSMTYKVQNGFWSGNYDTEVYLTRTTTTATLVFNSLYSDPNTRAPWVSHGLSTSDNLFIYAAGAPFDCLAPPNPTVGIPIASVVDNRTVTFTVANSGASVGAPGFYVARIFVSDHPIVTGATGSTAGNYAYPINFIRTNITTFGSGALTLSLNQGV